MTVHSLTEALEDTAALHDVAKLAGITFAQAKAFAAALGDLPCKQVIRLCAVSQADRVRQINRATRVR